VRVSIVVVLVALLLGAAPSQAKPPRPPAPPPTLGFGGQQWYVKSSSGKVGPGPNYFASANAFLDSRGDLHLRIDRDKRRRWQSAEVFAASSLGYGTYRWTVGTDVSDLDPNVVLGLFTWSDTAVQANRELDIELARWGSATDPTNAQFVVQPWDTPGHMVRFAQPTGESVLQLTWSPGQVAFRSTVGTTVVREWTYSGADVPTPGDERPHMNLWLMNGSAPQDGQPVEVVLTDFRHCALGTATC
jgi:hypothetical protein